MRNQLPVLLIIFSIVNALVASIPFFLVVPKLTSVNEVFGQPTSLSMIKTVVVIFWVLSFVQLVYGLFLKRKLKTEDVLKSSYVTIGVVLLVVPTGLLLVVGLPLTVLWPIYKLTSSF